MKAQVIRLAAHEPAVVDAERIAVLRQSLGPERFPEVVSAVVSHLSERLARIDFALQTGELAEAERHAARVASLGEQVGLADLARVARDLRHILASGEDVAIAAVASRLARLGEESLAAVMAHIDLSAL